MLHVSEKHKSKCRIKKGDEVKVITGRHKGTNATVERIDRKFDRVYLAGLNIAKKHVKPTSQNPEGGIVEKIMPIHISNVMLVDPKTKKVTRVGYETSGDKKVRIAKKSKTTLG